MIDDKSYEAILNKYNILVSKYNNLIEEMGERNSKWVSLQESWNTTDKKIRDLCEMILSKDRDEVNGNDKTYTWRSVTTDDLIEKSKTSYEKYNSNRNKLMRHMSEMIADRTEEIENLKLQIMQIMNRGVEGYEGPIEAEEKDDEILTSRVKTSEPVDTSKCKIYTVKDDDLDLVSGEESELVEEAKMGEKIIGTKIKALASSIGASPSRKEAGILDKARKTSKLSHVADLNKIIEKINDEQWELIRLIGVDGVCRYPALQEKTGLADSKVRTNLTVLTSSGITDTEQTSTPFVSKIMIYSLTDIGRRIFEHHFHKQVVLTEAEKIIAEHDNLCHGYAIVQIGEMIAATEGYSEVSTFNRKKAIKFKDSKGSYIPDIIYRCGKFINYIEYERGHHTQSDFSAKCNKMIQVTRFLQFVVDKQDTLDHVSAQVKDWAEAKGVGKIKGCRVKICTARYLKETVLTNSSAKWQIEYDFNNGTTPVRI